MKRIQERQNWECDTLLLLAQARIELGEVLAPIAGLTTKEKE